jgi:tetratricopeptide (TPR) repeat protein
MTSAQDKIKKEFNKAVENIRQKKYEKAEEQLLKLLNEYPNYLDANQALAEIYFARPDTAKARMNYEKYLANDSNNDVVARMRLAKLYFRTHDWDNTKRQCQIITSKLEHETIASKIRQKERLIAELKFIIANLEFQKDCLAHPKLFLPRNFGDAINSSGSEYLPTMTADEAMMLFTFMSDETSGNNKEITEDFYYSVLENGEWQSRKKIPYPLNSEENDGAGCISPDGKFIYFTKCNDPSGFGSCDIFVSKRIGNKWTYPSNLGSNVNSSYWDTQPSIASDGKTLYFVSNRPGGEGGSDIYVTKKKKDGTSS